MHISDACTRRSVRRSNSTPPRRTRHRYRFHTRPNHTTSSHLSDDSALRWISNARECLDYNHIPIAQTVCPASPQKLTVAKFTFFEDSVLDRLRRGVRGLAGGCLYRLCSRWVEKAADADFAVLTRRRPTAITNGANDIIFDGSWALCVSHTES